MEYKGEGFNELLQQAEHLASHMDRESELPRVERNIHQIMESSQRLYSKVSETAPSDSDIVKASILLGSKGVNVAKLSEKLDSISTSKTFEPLDAVPDTDIETFLKNERENCILAAMESSIKRTSESAEQRHFESVYKSWDDEKHKIMTALAGLERESGELVPERGSFLQGNIGDAGRSGLSAVEMAYSRQVYRYNEAVINGGLPLHLFQLFTEVADQLGDENTKEVWSLVSFMAGGPYVGDARQSQDSVTLRQALRYLQIKFKKYMEATVAGNLTRAARGGAPGTLALVRGFLNVLLEGDGGLEDGNVEGVPVWGAMWYCLRAGDGTAAVAVAERCRPQLGEFADLLAEFVSGDGLQPSSRQQVALKYKRSVSKSSDPYKRAVYCVVGRCSVADNHSDVANRIEDYLWLKLSQCSRDASSDTDRIELPTLAARLSDQYGESHFNASSQPHLYFQTLFLTGQFESAIEFFSRIDSLRVHAVHVAVALHASGLLLVVSDPQRDPTLTQRDRHGQRRLNLPRLVASYTSRFQSTDPREALHYFYLLRDFPTSDGRNLFMSSLSELVLETREFELLLGCVREDGSRKPGCVERFGGGDPSPLVAVCAEDAEQRGLLEDAVKLYELAGLRSKVVHILNQLLSRLVSKRNSSHSERQRLTQYSIAVAKRFQDGGFIDARDKLATFHLLLDLSTFFDLYHEQQVDKALEVIEELKVFPSSLEQVDGRLDSFMSFSDEIRHVLPDCLIATMTLLLRQCSRLKATPQSPAAVARGGGLPLSSLDCGRDVALSEIRSKARSLTAFLGKLPYRMPGDTGARLLQMEVLMN